MYEFLSRRPRTTIAVGAALLASVALVVGMSVAATSGSVGDAIADLGAKSSQGDLDADPAAAQMALAASPAVQAQLDYALAHWSDYNLDEFGDLNPVGGDCQNFVSQTLLARGWQMTDEWYSYDGGEDWSSPWGFVPAFDEWLRDHPEYGATETASLDERSDIQLGDLVVFDWDGDGELDHIQVVTSIATVDGTTLIGMAGHNNDSDYRDLDLAITVDHPGATGYFWRIP